MGEVMKTVQTVVMVIAAVGKMEKS